MLMERKACCHVANAFLGRLELIWRIFCLKNSQMASNAALVKSSRSQWLRAGRLSNWPAVRMILPTWVSLSQGKFFLINNKRNSAQKVLATYEGHFPSSRKQS